jgi:hypothetical protein
MPKPKGEGHHSATITLEQAQEIKANLASGKDVARTARGAGVPYQTAYRIATGDTWRDAEPAGAVKGLEHAIRGPKRKADVKKWYKIWNAKRRGVSIQKIAQLAGLSTSSVRRLASEFEIVIAHRISQLQLTSGSYEPAKRKYGIRRSEAERLDQKALNTPLPSRLQGTLAKLPGLEREIASDG